MTKNAYYKERYTREAQVYDILMKNNADHTLKFYGKGNITGTPEAQILKIEGKNVQIDYKAPDDNEYFYIALEYNPNYCTLYDIKNPGVQNKCFPQICNSIYELNKKFGFVHGDLKSDNVMVDRTTIGGEPSEVKVINFDFDFSHFIYDAEKKFIQDYSPLFEVKRGPDFKKPFSGKKIDDSITSRIDSETKKFFYFFDIWRLYCSMYTLFDRSYFYDKPYAIVKHNFNIPEAEEEPITKVSGVKEVEQAVKDAAGAAAAGAAAAELPRQINIKDLIIFDLILQDKLTKYVGSSKVISITQNIDFVTIDYHTSRYTYDSPLPDNIVYELNNRKVISYSLFSPADNQMINLFNNFYVHPEIINDLITFIDDGKDSIEQLSDILRV